MNYQAIFIENGEVQVGSVIEFYFEKDPKSVLVDFGSIPADIRRVELDVYFAGFVPEMTSTKQILEIAEAHKQLLADLTAKYGSTKFVGGLRS